MLVKHLQISVIALRRQEEGAIDERVLIEDRHRCVADDTPDLGYLVGTQVGKHKTARFVVAMGAFVLHLDVVGVLLVPRKHCEHGIIGSTAKDITSRSLLSILEKVELFLQCEARRCFRWCAC